MTPSTFRVFLCRWLGLHVWVRGKDWKNIYERGVDHMTERPVRTIHDHTCAICGRTKWFST